LIVDAIARQRPVHFRATTSEALDFLEAIAAPGDLVLTLGAGNIGDAADMLLARLGARAAAAPGTQTAVEGRP
jgi:UDP-N-acetylmuramate-alanine ligase